MPNLEPGKKGRPYIIFIFQEDSSGVPSDKTMMNSVRFLIINIRYENSEVVQSARHVG